MKFPIGLLIFVAFFLLYWLTPTGYCTFDAVSYANQIAHLYPRTLDLHWLFHPHHLLFNALGYGLWHLAQTFGYRGGPLVILERLNSLCGAAGLGVLFAIVQRVSRAKAVLISVGIGLSFGWWACATDGRVNMPALLLMLTAFLALQRLGELPTMRRAIAAGILAGMATLFHESAGLFVLVTAAGAWTAGRQIGERRRLLIAALIAWSLTVSVPYLGIGIFALGLHSPAAFHEWTNRYAELGWWWDFHLLRDLQMDGYALRRAMFADLPLRPHFLLLLLSLFSAAGGMALLFAFGLSVWRLRTQAERRLPLLCLLWLLVYGVFFTFWTPDYFVFKLYLLLPAVILIGFVDTKTPRWVSILSLVWIAGYGTWNFAASLRPHLPPTSNPFYRVAMEIRAHTRPGDVVVLTGAGDLAQCEVDVPYYADREVVSLHSLLTRAHDDTATAWSEAQGQVDVALREGHSVYALGEVWQSRRAWADLRRHHPNAQLGQGAALLSPYQWVLAWSDAHGGVWQLSYPVSPQAGFSGAAAKLPVPRSEKAAVHGH